MWFAEDDQYLFDERDLHESYVMDICRDAATLDQTMEWWMECYSDMSDDMRAEIREIVPLFLQLENLPKDRFWRIVDVFKRYGYYDLYVNVIMSLANNARVSYNDCQAYDQYAKQHGG